MAYVIVLKAPCVKNANNLNENKIVTTFESVDKLNGELNVKMVNLTFESIKIIYEKL